MTDRVQIQQLVVEATRKKRLAEGQAAQPALSDAEAFGYLSILTVAGKCQMSTYVAVIAMRPSKFFSVTLIIVDFSASTAVGVLGQTSQGMWDSIRFEMY
jgi:hypothetical protein